MRIIYDEWGQMCNRLWQYIDQVAWAMKNNEKVVSLFWDPSLNDFDNLRNNPYIKFPLYIRVFQKGKTGDLYRRTLIKLLHNHVVQGIFAKPFFQKHGFVNSNTIMFRHEYYPEVWEQEKGLFAPSTAIAERIDAEFDHCRQNSTGKIVGIHLRKGDYKDYYDGFYYYEDEEYADFMRQMVKLLGEDTYFFIASNEKIDKDHFKEFHMMDSHNTKAAEDMYCLSKCDYIMGPFSTFSGWASFYGQVPYYYFRRKAKITLSDFHIIQFMTRPPKE